MKVLSVSRNKVLSNALVVVVVSILMFGLQFRAAEAALITFNFEGTVTGVSPALSGTFSAGQTLIGSYTFESTVLDTISDPIVGGYAGALTALSFTIGGYSVGLGSGFNTIEVANSNSGDVYTLEVTQLSGATVGGFDPERFMLVFIDTTGSVFSSTALPLTPPDLSDFDATVWGLAFGTQQPPLGVQGELTSLTLAEVPEPASATLFISGLLGLGVLTWRRHLWLSCYS